MEIINFKQDISSFMTIMMNQMISVKDSIIDQKNREVILKFLF